MNRYINTDHPLLIPLYSDLRKCVVCGVQNPSHTIPPSVIIALYYENDIFVRFNHKICGNESIQTLSNDIHPVPYMSNQQYTHCQRNYQLYKYQYSQLQLQHTNLTNEQDDHQCHITFANSSDERIKSFCRISKQNIIQLSNTHDISREDLFIFYSLCYRGSAYRYFEHITQHSRSAISRRFRSVLTKLHSDFVPTQLNKSWTRDKVKQNTPDFVKELYGLGDDRILIITDGFMIYTGKSANFDTQHREYNSYKKRNCWIFHPFICANGRYIINLGPYCSDERNTDQFIYESATDIDYLHRLRDHHDGTHPLPEKCIMYDENTTDILIWFNTIIYTLIDSCTADRGYTEIDDDRLECPPMLNAPRPKGRRPKKAPKPRPKRKQLPPDEAMQFRKVTIIRHTPERNYARIKQWEITKGLIPWQFRDCIKEIVEILMATDNQFFCDMTVDSIKNQRYMRRIMDHIQNHSIKVMPWLKEKGWKRRGRLPSDCVRVIKSMRFLPDFDDTDIRELGMGDCNWKLSKRYIRQFVNQLEVYVHSKHPKTILFQKVTSRYTDTERPIESKKFRDAIIDFENSNRPQCTCNHDPCRCEGLRRKQRLLYLAHGRQYYCTCKIGSRSSNPCAHITALLAFIWYIKCNELNNLLSRKPIAYSHALAMNCYHHQYWKTEKDTFSVHNNVRNIVLSDGSDDNDDDNYFGGGRSPSTSPSAPDRGRRRRSGFVGASSSAQNSGQQRQETTNSSTTNTNNLSSLQPAVRAEYGGGSAVDEHDSDNDVVQNMPFFPHTPSGSSAANGTNIDINMNTSNGTRKRRHRYNLRSTAKRQRHK